MNILKDYQKTCPTCMKDFEANRTNQIYCSPRCKILKNNHKARRIKDDYEDITYEVNQRLWSNRVYLKTHVGEEVMHETVSKKDFQLRYITNFFKDKTLNTTIFVIYDYAYYFIDSATIKIIKHA